VEILSREAQGPAAGADLRAGDLIVSVNGHSVDGIDALHRALGRVAPGTELQLSIVRRTQLSTVSLTAREPP
jgi:serine protease Do